MGVAKTQPPMILGNSGRHGAVCPNPERVLGLSDAVGGAPRRRELTVRALEIIAPD
jgi:hypothetical protein